MKKIYKKQVGGNHYKIMKIQPIEFINKNNLNFNIGNIIKYAVREKGNLKKRIEDLEKIKQYVDFEIDRIK